jgi:regulator of replication initiation timing
MLECLNQLEIKEMDAYQEIMDKKIELMRLLEENEMLRRKEQSRFHKMVSVERLKTVENLSFNGRKLQVKKIPHKSGNSNMCDIFENGQKIRNCVSYDLVNICVDFARGKI